MVNISQSDVHSRGGAVPATALPGIVQAIGDEVKLVLGTRLISRDSMDCFCLGLTRKG